MLKRSMRLDKIRLIFFSNGETDFRQFEFNLQRLLWSILLVVMVFSGLFLGSVAISNRLYQDNTNSSLAKTNAYLKKKIKTLHGSVDKLNEKINVLEQDTEDLEVLVGLTSEEDETKRKKVSYPTYGME